MSIQWDVGVDEYSAGPESYPYPTGKPAPMSTMRRGIHGNDVGPVIERHLGPIARFMLTKLHAAFVAD